MKSNSLQHRVTALLCIFVLTFSVFPLAASALDDPNIEAAAVYLADPDSGMILYQKNADEKRYPASTTKMMTALLVLENANLEDTVTAEKEDFATIAPGSSNAGILVGETMTVHDLLYCLMLPSANEAATILARHVAGSIDAFVDMMNARATELGCTGTHFANPNGLHDENHYTTAHDLYLIAQAAMQNETFAEIANTAQKTLQATNLHPARKIYTTNYLTLRKSDPSFYTYCKGIKTGHTSQAGYCLVAVADKNGGRLLSVVLGCEQPEGQVAKSFTETKRLFEWGYTNYKSKELVSQDESVTEIPVRLSTEADSVVLQTNTSLSALVPTDLQPEDLERTLDLPDDQTAPIKEGDVLGHMTISYDGFTYGTVDLVAMNDVSLSKVLYYADKLENFFRSRFFKYSVLALAGIFVLTFLYRFIRLKRRHHRRQQSIRNRYR